MWPNKDRGTARVLFVGDVCGKPGMEAIQKLLPGLLRASTADFCIVNGENAEQGKGILPAQVQDIFQAGADVISGGNHTMYRDKFIPLLEADPRVLRPFNYPPNTIGRGSGLYDLRGGVRIGVVNLIGRAMMTAVDDPFRLGKAEIERLREETPLVIVDFHAEASAEKLAFARYVDGLATAVIGTHTHVPTADNDILAGGTAFITDVGMTGPHNGVIGMKTEAALHRFLNPLGGGKSGVAEGDVRLNLVMVDAEALTGKALRIERRQVRLTP